MPRSTIGRVVVVALVSELILLLANVAASFLTDWTGIASWFAGPALALVAGVVVAVFGKYAEEPGGRTPPPGWRPSPGWRPPLPPPRRRSGGVAAALVVLVLLVAVGGGLTFGVRYAVGLVTGDETGVSVLVAPAEGKGSGVSLTVQDVVYTPNFTRVTVLATNTSRPSVTLPVFGNCVFVGEDGTTLEADPFRSHWSESLPPGAKQLGTLVFPGRLPAGATRASLSFATVFVFGPGSGAATVKGIRLDPTRLTAS